MTRAALYRALTFAALALSPSAAWACPVCQDPRDQNQAALLTGTVLLSVLPLLMIGGIILFVRHQLRSAERRDERSAAPLQTPAE